MTSKAPKQDKDNKDDQEESLTDGTEAELEQQNTGAAAAAAAAFDDNEASEDTGSEEGNPWISWFVNMRGNEFFCAVDEDFIQDDFNLTGLSTSVPHYEHAIDTILDVEIPLEKFSDEQQDLIETAAEVIYGLIHARYLITSRGMQKMHEKFSNCDFGRCPRVQCQGQPTLPVGLSDTPRLYPVNIFCPSCQEIYYPRSSKHAHIDGAYFGTTFAHIFLLNYPELIPTRLEEMYVPRIYGFKISVESPYYRRRFHPEEDDDDE